MIKRIDEYDKYVAIAGYRKLRMENVEGFLGTFHRKKEPAVEVQFFDARLVATWQHLYFAALNALTAFRNEQRISKSLAMETMLYASAQRQIRKATQLMGIKPNSPIMAVLIIGKRLSAVESALKTVRKRVDGKQDDTVLELSKEKEAQIKKAFGITELQLQTATKKDDSERALVDLVIERGALLATER